MLAECLSAFSWAQGKYVYIRVFITDPIWTLLGITRSFHLFNKSYALFEKIEEPALLALY